MQKNPENTSHVDSPWLRFVRLYTFHFPIDKGKGRLYRLSKKFVRTFPQNVVVKTRDGRRLRVSFRDWVEEMIYFLGTCDIYCTKLVRRHVKSGAVCVDVGANLGWYTTLFRLIAGENGQVHSFEPVPQTFARLEKNVSLNGAPPNVYLNNFALGDEEKDLEIHVFADQPSGHSSLAVKEGEKSEAIQVKVKTLDSYLTERGIKQVDFLKVDIEGAELMFLKGAEKLFKQSKPPVILMEMALQTSKEFGYTPNDLLEFIGSHAAYDFFAVDEIKHKLIKIEKFADTDIGANVLCVPQK